MASGSDLRLLCVLAHPDDESLGTGGALAKYAAEGVATYLVTATRGERGRFFDGRESPEVVGRTRQAELLDAAQALGVRDVAQLGYPDGALASVPAADAIAAIACHIDRVKPHVVITFAHDGAYGHPDHIAWSERKWSAYQAALKKLVSVVDGEERQVVPWPLWAVTTVIDTTDVWDTVWRAVSCHKTQMAIFTKLDALADEHKRSLWGSQEFYRAFSLVNGGRAKESDVFEGLR